MVVPEHLENQEGSSGRWLMGQCMCVSNFSRDCIAANPSEPFIDAGFGQVNIGKIMNNMGERAKKLGKNQ